MDTKAVIAILNDKPKSVRMKLRAALKRGEVQVSSIILFELWYRVAKNDDAKADTERLRIFLTGEVSPVEFSEADAQAAGEIRATLEATGKMIGACDLLIAGQARRLGATLVTANEGKFNGLPELRWENWADA